MENKTKAMLFPGVAFPKDFRETVMSGKREYDIDYLINRGFVVVYTLIDPNDNEESYNEAENLLRGMIKEITKPQVIIADMGNKEFKKYFNDVLFSRYDMIKGMGIMGIFPLDILFLITSLTSLLSENENEEGIIHMRTAQITSPNTKGRVYLFLISNKKYLVEEPFNKSILDAHLDNLRKIMKEYQEPNQKGNIYNQGILIQGQGNILSNIENKIGNSFFELIIKEIKSRKLSNEKELIEAANNIKKEGKSSKFFSFLEKNAPWITPLLNIALNFR